MPSGLELEQAARPARGEQLVGLRVVERECGRARCARPVCAAIIFTQLSISVSVRRPRKSIFRRPMRSTPFMSYCVVMSAVLPLKSGHEARSAAAARSRRPAAWVDACRVVPSSRREMSISSLTFGSFW